MKRPWQVWSIFGVALAVAVGIMAWLTNKTIELDRAEAEARAELDLARRQAELDDRVSQALWRMDTALAPLIAQEAVRPAQVYDPLLTVAATKGKSPNVTEATMSPILKQPSPFVLLHFQATPKGAWSSPQSPTGYACAVAIENGASCENINVSSERLQQISAKLDPSQLLAQLPADTLPGAETNQKLLSLNPNQSPGQNSAYVVNSDSLDNNLRQQQQVEQFGTEPNEQASIDLPQAAERETAQSARRQTGRMLTQSPNSAGANNLNRSQLNDFQSRGRSLQNYSQQAEAQQRLQPARMVATNSLASAVAGVSRPLWVGDQLVLARRVTQGTQTLVQGVWLDWPALDVWLKDSVADVLPEMTLVPVAPGREASSARLLASLPVELIVAAPQLASATVAPLGLPLLLAWSCLAFAAAAVAALLFGVLRLSERRAAFVSAVTHELRTPLTTFRLYTDLLAQGMVTDESRRSEYIHTLHAEADRLGHLVENVLSFARLERRSKASRRETVTLGKILDSARERLATRAEQAQLSIDVIADDATRAVAVTVDPTAVEQVLFNLVDNACKYAAASTDRRVHLEAAAAGANATIRVRDHGPGIPPSLAREIFRPFSRPLDQAHPNVPGVGLGLALCRRLARSMKGELDLARSTPSEGATFELRLPRA